MEIYTEEKDPNESKDSVIKDISSIVSEYGSFTISDVEADSSPIIESKGKLVHLMEDFKTDGGVVYVYDPTSYMSEEIDTYFEDYLELEESQLEVILELAQKWAEINE